MAAGLKSSVIVGVSEGEREFIGTRQAAAVVKSLRDEYDFPIFLNADHTHSLHSAMEAAEAGYDWIVFDASNQPFEDNIRQTKDAVEALKGIRPEILVEGEIGKIGSGSELHDSATTLRLTTPLEAKHFVAETQIDTLAPAVGNMHGMLRTMVTGRDEKTVGHRTNPSDKGRDSDIHDFARRFRNRRWSPTASDFCGDYSGAHKHRTAAGMAPWVRYRPGERGT